MSGGSALVSMMKPAYFGKRTDFPHLRRLHGPALRRILPKRNVASRTMVIIKIRNQMAPERNLIQDDDMVEAFSADRADQPFNLWALPGRSESGENLADVQAFDQRPKCCTIDAVAVPEQVPRRFVPREGLHDLGCGPLGSGMLGDIEMNDAPAIMSQNKKNVQDPESNGGDHEEVHRHQLPDVVL